MTPTMMAKKRLPVTVLISRRRLLPATACIPSDMDFMPKRKMPSPPINSPARWKKFDRFTGVLRYVAEEMISLVPQGVLYLV
jgi:hypothetical protein